MQMIHQSSAAADYFRRNLHLLLLPQLLRSLITHPVYSCRRSENLTLFFFAVLQKCLRRTNEHHLLHLLGPRRGPFASLSAHVNAMEKCFVLRCHSKKICHNVSQEPTDVVLAAAALGASNARPVPDWNEKKVFRFAVVAVAVSACPAAAMSAARHTPMARL